jgi:hypothetical protein
MPKNGLLKGYIPEEEPDEFGVTVRTLRGWRSQGTGPACTFVGASAYYRREAVEQWLLSREKKPPRERGRKRSIQTEKHIAT